MAYECKVAHDSISSAGVRLTTVIVTYPRMVHSETLTHRQFSRNSASSRAIPVTKMIEKIMEDPVEPLWWGKQQSGMQAYEELSIPDQLKARSAWNMAKMHAIQRANDLVDLGTHKQIANRILEPFSWITVIITATEWENFFGLRCEKGAQPELQKIAYMMEEVIRGESRFLDNRTDDLYLRIRESIDHGHFPTSKPTKRNVHMPLLQEDEESIDTATYDLRQISAARCARVSYLTHHGKRDLSEDIRLFNSLTTNGHWSPLEHVAVALPLEDTFSSSNFRGWHQFRKDYPNEVIKEGKYE